MVDYFRLTLSLI